MKTIKDYMTVFIGVAGLCIFSIGLKGLIGYWLKNIYYYKWSIDDVGMAIGTCIAFEIIGLALLVTGRVINIIINEKNVK